MSLTYIDRRSLIRHSAILAATVVTGFLPRSLEALEKQKSDEEASQLSQNPLYEQWGQFELRQIGNCATIDDNTTQDNGALACLRKSWPDHKNHNGTVSAVSNLLQCSPIALNTAMLVLVGHGTEGLIVTSGGQSWVEGIAVWNENYDWGPKLVRIKDHQFAVLTLFACETGAGEDGADLLYNMAKVINRPVRARTGLVSCGGGGQIFFEPGSTWQMANPQGPRPTPIPKPPHKTFSMNKNELVIVDDRHSVSIKKEDIKSVVIVRISLRKRTEQKITLDVQEGFPLLQLIDFKNPVINIGAVPAIKTGTIDIQFMSKGTLSDKKYVLYNDRFVQDENKPNVYYFSDDSLQRALNFFN